MLDIRFIRNIPERVQQNARDKGYSVDVPALLELDETRRSLQQQVDELREKRNANAAQMKGGKPTEELIDEGKRIKIELAERESYLTTSDEEFTEAMSSIPNTIFE